MQAGSGGAGGPRRVDGELLCVGKDAYRVSRDAEGESELTSLALLLEPCFSAPSLFLPMQSDLESLLDMLLERRI